MSTGLANTLKMKNSGKSVFGLKNKNNYNKNKRLVCNESAVYPDHLYFARLQFCW
jgi:hypothetical protein